MLSHTRIKEGEGQSPRSKNERENIHSGAGEQANTHDRQKQLFPLWMTGCSNWSAYIHSIHHWGLIKGTVWHFACLFVLFVCLIEIQIRNQTQSTLIDVWFPLPTLTGVGLLLARGQNGDMIEVTPMSYLWCWWQRCLWARPWPSASSSLLGWGGAWPCSISPVRQPRTPPLPLPAESGASLRAVICRPPLLKLSTRWERGIMV